MNIFHPWVGILASGGYPKTADTGTQWEVSEESSDANPNIGRSGGYPKTENTGTQWEPQEVSEESSDANPNIEVVSELLATAELEDVPETTQPQEVTEVSTSLTSQEVLPNDNPVDAQWEPQEVSEDSSDANPNIEVVSKLLATAELEDVPETNQPQEVTEVSTSPASQEVLQNDNLTKELPDDSENPENIALLR